MNKDQTEAACVAAGTGVAAIAAGCLLRIAPGPIWQLLLLGLCIAMAGAGLAWQRMCHDAKTSREELARLHAQHQLLLESVEVTPAPYALYDREDRLVAWNRSYQELHEPAFSRLPQPILYSDLIREALRQALPPDAVEAAMADRVTAQRDADGRPHDRLYSSGRWYRVCKKRTRSGAVAGFASDITELKSREAELAESEARFRALSESCPTGIWRIADDGTPLYANPALLQLLCLDQAENFGERVRDLLNPVSQAMIAARRSANCSRRFELQLRTAHGDLRQVLVVTTDWLGLRDGKDSCVATIVDITELKAAQDRIEHLANHDALTGLGNRTLFSRALDAATRKAARDGAGVALIAIDLDHFKEVNDTYGHAAGDAVLRAAAKRMRAAIGETDLACRLGGDEFAIILERTTPAIVKRIAENLLSELTRSFELDGHRLHLGASIGIARFPNDSHSVEELMRNADVALYQTKRQGRCRIAYYGDTATEIVPA